jgi:hypothetical protein
MSAIAEPSCRTPTNGAAVTRNSCSSRRSWDVNPAQTQNLRTPGAVTLESALWMFVTHIKYNGATVHHDNAFRFG